MFRLRRLSLLALGASLCLSCSLSPPLSMEPVNGKIQTQLPSLNSNSTDLRSFSFRIITPVENVDVFSILQARTNTRILTLPVDQLEEVKVAKEKITSSAFLDAATATVLAYETSRRYNWDTEVARQVLVEIVTTYAKHRDRELKKFREKAEERAQYFIEQNRIASEEIAAQARAVAGKGFDDVPLPQPRTIEEQNKLRQQYRNYMDNRIAKNRAAQEEYKLQAKAALDKYLKQLDETTRKAREKEEQAQKLRQAQFEQILASQKKLMPELPTDFGLLAADQAPYQLLTLSNGDFMLEAHQALPAVIQLQVNDFELPISVPVLPQTSNGRLLISIEKDAQGRPVVYGGMDAPTGFGFDLESPLFTLRYLDHQQQQLEFIYPDGRLDRIDVQSLENINSDDALSQLQPQVLQLPAADLKAKQAFFGGINYEITPELDQMLPTQALEILNGVQQAL